MTDRQTAHLLSVQDRFSSTRPVDTGFKFLTLVAALTVGILLLSIASTLTVQAWPAITDLGWNFLVGTQWNSVPGRETYGALPMILGTLASSGLALMMALPLGLGSAIALAEDFLPRPGRQIGVFMVELLAAIPSVVYGLWGIFILIPALLQVESWLHTHLGWIPLFSTPPMGPGLLPASVVLAIMILPMIAAISRDTLTALPQELRQASLGLGATRWGTLLRVLIPAAFPGILGGVMLALGRALGETMAVTMLIGNANQIPRSLWSPTNTIASLLATQFTEARDLQIAALMYAALVLLLMTLGINVLADLIVRRVRAPYLEG
ncbi:MAG: phosphate ABC transporter permease subunit PstC [Synechococcaceae cyanobacterium SM2_3_1]|nr:phosphate ABC transporter permease subunit PstC [Synechococcaceae cyanobacterium SM2_3_1]